MVKRVKCRIVRSASLKRQSAWVRKDSQGGRLTAEAWAHAAPANSAKVAGSVEPISAADAGPSGHHYKAIIGKAAGGVESAEGGPRGRFRPYRHRRKIPRGLVLDFLA